MKKSLPLLAFLTCLAFGTAAAHGAVAYWDGNSTNSGAGDTPVGTWDTDAFWAYDAAGGDGTNLWNNGDIAVFAAGTSATNAYTVSIVGAPLAGGITFQEGLVTLAAGIITMTNEVQFPIIANTNAIIGSDLADFGGGANPSCGILKTGPGTLTLSGAGSAYGGTNATIVAEGTLAYSTAAALGSSGSGSPPIIVSNGATLKQIAAVDITKPVILNGMGLTNGGALAATAVPSAGTQGWKGGAVLGSDARINSYTGTQWTWLTAPITNNGNNCSVYFGGTGGTIRLNINGRAIQLAGGFVYKDGSTELRFETPINCAGIYFNGGHILSRVGSGIISENSPINVGAGAGQFRTGSGGPSWSCSSPLILTNGANPVFNPNATFSISWNTVISGPGGLSKANPGTLNLNAQNTYSGNTTVIAGLLALGANGSISNSAVIDVQTGAVLDVVAVTGGFILRSAQTLKGNGGVNGNVTANGTLSAGASVGNLTFSNNLTLGVGAKLIVEVDKSLSPSNDVITVLGTITNTGTGTVTVTRIGGPALQVGDSFPVFSQGVSNGLALTITSGVSGLVFTNRLDVDGSIAVLAVPPVVPATNLTITAQSAASYKVGGIGGTNPTYGVYASTNLTPPLTNWWLIGTTNSNGSGVIQFTDPQATNAQRFYRFGQ